MEASEASDFHRDLIVVDHGLDRIFIRWTRSFAIGGTAWTVAIFRDRRHNVDTSRSLDLHRTGTILPDLLLIVATHGASDFHRTDEENREIGTAQRT